MVGLGDRLKAAVNTVKAEVIVAKANYDTRSAGYNPDDYAKFDTDERSEDKED